MMASVQKALIKSAKELGVKTLTRTSGKKIIQGANGRVIGVVAVDKDGKEFEIQTRSVVIATGGFGANRELLKKYCPDYYDEMHLWEWPVNFAAHSGDGMYMAEEIGAAMADWVPIYHRAGPDFGGYPWKPVLPRMMNQYMIWVNKTGKRFADEVGCMGMNAGNILLQQQDQIAYALFADDLVQTAEVEAAKPVVGAKPQKHAKLGGGAIVVTEQPFTGLREKLQELAEKKGLKIADSWDEMAGWMGVNPEALKAEIDEYNSYCDKGHDDAFAKEPKYLMPLRKSPYYAIRIYGDAGETLGGIKVDEHMAVLDKQGNVIPGVFAAGVIADGHQGQTYNHDDMAGSAVGFAVNSGRIAGRSAAKFITGK
jgi:fumarate reductase flavoprotein subunit